VWIAIAAALIAVLGMTAASIVERPILLTPPIASPAAAPVAAIQIGEAAPLEPAVVIAAPEPRLAPAGVRSAPKRRSAVAPAKRRAKPHHTSFFQKELFRIVFK
jgi:hypothetical protein